MSAGVLQQIQAMQFHDRSGAESLLLSFLREVLQFDVTAVELRPLAVSLNSFNGFMTLADGKRLFFKTHTEPDNVIGEYYHAAQLAEAGYPVILPVYSSMEAGKQLLVYEVISDPSVFDLAWAVECGETNQASALLMAAQNEADEALLRIYRNTLKHQSAEEAASAPVHQLFHHRLVQGRFQRFYGPLPGDEGAYPNIELPSGRASLYGVRKVHWEINGQLYDDSLDDLIRRAVRLLEPSQAGPSIVGHGDAHNGNVFFHPDPPALTYFDPAFAGRHHPLLDLAKPLFHNVFAMWMYFPDVKRQHTRISLDKDGDLWRVQHDYVLHPVRMMFWRSKIERVVIPIIRDLGQQGWLRKDWRNYLKAALFCCPLLTMNLADSTRFPPEISLLGLAMAIEMGGESQGIRSLLDRTLDEIENAI